MSYIIKNNVTCYEPSEDRAVAALFFPIGFFSEKISSLAHLSEHCLMEIIRRELFFDRIKKPLFMQYNALTTSFYTCVWFSAPVSSYKYLRKLFIHAIDNIPNNISFIDDILINHEKNKISKELDLIKNNKDNQFINRGLLDENGLMELTSNDIICTINKYISQGGVLFEYGGIKQFETIVSNNPIEYPTILFPDNYRIVCRHVINPEIIHTARLISYIACQEGIESHIRQLTNEIISIDFNIPIKEAVDVLLKIDKIKFQYYIESYYLCEKKDCSDMLQYLKRMYKYYRQTGSVCNKFNWYNSICNVPDVYKKFLIRVRTNINE